MVIGFTRLNQRSLSGDAEAPQTARIAGSTDLTAAMLYRKRRDMLNLENLRARVRGGGFKPFKLHLTDGREIPVTHPEFIIVANHFVIAATDDGVSYTIDPLHIVAISELIPKPATGQATS